MRFIFCFFLLLSSPVFADQNSDFIAAHDAFLANDAVKLERYAKRLTKTPLEVYVDYYRLQLNLDNAKPETVRKFLARPEDSPIIDLLRVEWLKVLGKKQQWDLFDAEYPRVINEDQELACYALQSRRRTQELAVLYRVRGLWFNGKSLPDSCGDLFDAAITAGIITQYDIKIRLRLALEAVNIPLATSLAERMNGTYPGLSAALKAAAANPDRYTESFTPDKTSEGLRIVTLFALQRIAKQSSSLAAERWEKIAATLPDDEQHYFYGQLAYEAARNLDDRALQWYKAADGAPLNEKQMAWRVRAALRAQDWEAVLADINAMGAQQQRESAWIYWKARALQALGNVIEARTLFAPLSAEYSFYGQLAGEELPDAPVLSQDVPAYKPDKKLLATISGSHGVKRTIALYKADLRSEALEEWRWVLRNFNDQELLAASEVARHNEMYDRAIGAAEKTVRVHDFSMRYLAPYRVELQSHIREHGLDEAWVYGLMRQESRFALLAKSDTGASGLMQVMPDTARWIAKKLGLKSYRYEFIHQIDTNLRLGTYYMKTIFTQSDNNPVLATAAYNAGPLRALQWRADHPLEGAIYAETIPFEETREYVKKVMSNAAYYAKEFDTTPRSLTERLGIIPARIPGIQPAIPDVP